MIDHADVVVIGSGALGASTAWHLATAGRRVALVDQHAIGSQTSPRAAGLSAQVRHSEPMTRLAVRAVEQLMTFTRDTGEPLDLHRSGSLKVARNDAHAEQVHAEVTHGQALGVEIRRVDPDEARALMPFLDPTGTTAISFTPGDVYLDPAQLPIGYARAAEKRGCTLLPHVRVEEVIVTDGAVEGVATSRGVIRAPVVVDAAGAWLRRVAAACGASLPMVATRHQLLITTPIDGVRPEQPITRIIDANVYVRPCDGGLMLGGYEEHPLQLAMEDLPDGFEIADMPLDLDVLHSLAAKVRQQFPIFSDASVAMLRGGLPTVTPDDEHVIGPIPGIDGLYVIGGCNVGGLSTAPAFGELLTAMILGHEPLVDASDLRPARFGAQKYSELELRELCREHYARHYWSATSRQQAERMTAA